MKKLVPFLFLVLIHSGCSNNVSKNERSNDNKSVEIQSEASVKINQSRVHAKIEDIYTTKEKDFVVKAKVIKVEEDPAYANIAVEGSVYMLTPSFKLNEDKKPDSSSERNSELMLLLEMKKNDEFKAVIFYEAQKGWFIRELIR